MKKKGSFDQKEKQNEKNLKWYKFSQMLNKKKLQFNLKKKEIVQSIPRGQLVFHLNNYYVFYLISLNH